MQWLPVFRLLERQEIIMTTKVYLGVGSNLNRENALRFAVAKKVISMGKSCCKSR